MKESFVYNIPTKVYFGKNQLKHLGKELAVYGKRVLLCYGGGSIKKSGLYQQVMEEIEKAGLTVFELSGIEPNPRVSSVNAGAAICKKEGIDVILAVGGGSVLDCAKFIGAAAYYDGDGWDISAGKVKVTQCVPLITILTLSATGSEMDAGGVITNLETKEKIGRAFAPMQPKVSFLDPTLTYSVSAYQTACGAADMLSHIWETYFNEPGKSMYMLDSVMESLMKTIIRYTPIALKEPENYEARANLMWASSWAINGFTRGCQTCAWTCHPIEHELSAFYDITHGLGLAILTPRWMRYVLDETTAPKFKQYGVQVWGLDDTLSDMEVATLAIAKTEEFLFDTLGLSRTLTEIGIDATHFEVMAQKACGGTVLAGFKVLTAEDIKRIYEMCL